MNKNVFVKFSFEQVFLILTSIIFAVGFLGHIFSLTFPLMKLLTPYVLLGFSLFFVYYIFNLRNKLILYWLGITYIVTLLLEITGVKTGNIFGDYMYGNTLGLKVFSVPFIIGLNWVFVILGAIELAKYVVFHSLPDIQKKFQYIVIPLLASIFATLFDVILEPVAIVLDYWKWIEKGSSDLFPAPLQNYITWFVIAFVFSLFYVVLKIEKSILILKVYFLIQLVFFLGLLIFID